MERCTWVFHKDAKSWSSGLYDVYARDCFDWWGSMEAKMIGPICRKVALIGHNCKVMQDSWELAEFVLQSQHCNFFQGLICRKTPFLGNATFLNDIFLIPLIMV